MNISYRLGASIQRVILAFAGCVLLVSITAARAAPPISNGDSIVVVVSAASPVTQISRLHLADLYTGRATRFPDGTPAIPYDQKPGLPARAAFSATYLGRSEAQMKAHWSKIIFTGRGRPPAEASSPQAMKELVAGNPSAIGYMDSRLVDSNLRIVRVK